MINPAPNNPATWRRIKAGVTAEQLGWPEDRLARICREHGYEYRPAGMAAVVSSPELPPLSATQANREIKIKHRAKRKFTPRGLTEEARERLKAVAPLTTAPFPEGPPIWNYMISEFSCGSMVVAIGGKQQTRIMSHLFNIYSVDPTFFAEGDELTRLVETTRESVRGICWYLSRRIAATGWQIQTVRGRCGYRLARKER